MKPTIHTFAQGSDEWHKHRASHFNASDASAMLGINPLKSRNELLRMHATGDEKEFSAWAQVNLLDKGHTAELFARAWVEKEIFLEALKPMVASKSISGLQLSASYDGAQNNHKRIWEHKLVNKSLSEALSRDEIPARYRPQLEQQLMILGAVECAFHVSDGFQGHQVAFYKSDMALRKRIIDGWKQFRDDLQNYQHVEYLPAPTGKAVMALPSLSLELVGEVRASNLIQYRASALDFLRSINVDLKTDQHFADADQVCKFCADKEAEIDAAKKAALAQTVSIAELLNALDEVKAALRDKRLDLSKLIEARKQTIRDEIVQSGVTAIQLHIARLNERLGHPVMPLIDCNFAGAAKGKRTIESLTNAVDTELAGAKIKANSIADDIQDNITFLRTLPADKMPLFPDALRAPLVLKSPEDFASTLRLRIADHDKAEEKRMEVEREKIRAEEKAKAEAAAAQEQAMVNAKARAEERIRLDAIEKELEIERAALQARWSQRIVTDDLAKCKADAEAKANAANVTKVTGIFGDDDSAFVSVAAARAVPTATLGSNRPTDDIILDALMQHFHAPELEIIGWLESMDLVMARGRLVLDMQELEAVLDSIE